MGMVFTGLGREADGRAGASLSLLRKRTHLEGWGLSREMAARGGTPEGMNVDHVAGFARPEQL